MEYTSKGPAWCVIHASADEGRARVPPHPYSVATPFPAFRSYCAYCSTLQTVGIRLVPKLGFRHLHTPCRIWHEIAKQGPDSGLGFFIFKVKVVKYF